MSYVIVSSKKKGSAIVEFKSLASAVSNLIQPYFVTGPLSLVSCLARFCTHPEVKFHVFDRLKRGEEKSIVNLFFRFSYENNEKI